jgi:hypothetical protein
MVILNDTPVNEVFKQVKNHHMYKGHFQSESYFKDFKEEIRKLYSIKKQHAAAFEPVIKQFSSSKKKLVIHVRRSDYIGLDLSLPVSYYKKAIEMVNDADVIYIFISDDPVFIEAEFAYLPNKYISSHDEITDLQFLIHADICILSNSSFSWWGAWLNSNKNKQVFAPKYWLGFKNEREYPQGIGDYVEFNWVQV